MVLWVFGEQGVAGMWFASAANSWGYASSENLEPCQKNAPAARQRHDTPLLPSWHPFELPMAVRAASALGGPSKRTRHQPESLVPRSPHF